MSSSEGKPDASEGEYLHTVNKDVPWYRPDIDGKLAPETRELLEKYSHIPRDEQSKHVHKIRDQAFAIRPYPCTGLGAFLTPQLCRLEVYPEILECLRNGGTLLDFGCFIGHDFRRLVYDGAPSENLYGVDIANQWNVGFDMFRDQSTFKAHFIEADVLATETNAELAPLKGRADIVSTLQVLHQWNWDGQVRAVKEMIAYTKPGSAFVGNQIGRENAGENSNEKMKMTVYFHNPASFAKMMNEVGEQTGTKWETSGRLLSFQDMGWEESDRAWIGPDVMFLEFAARRVE